MKKLNYLLILVVLLLAGCGSPVPEEPEKYKNTNVDNVYNYDEDNTNSDNVSTSDGLDDEFVPEAVTSDVHFYDYVDLEFAHYFVTDKDVIRDDTKYSKYDRFKHYTYGSIDIAETTITGCSSLGYYDDWFNNYIDESITACKGSDAVGYSITIPGGTYQAYLPKDTTVKECSVTNPIFCWGSRPSQEVRDYYSKNKKCPVGYRYTSAGVSGPTDMCSGEFRSCRKKVCGGKYCNDIEDGIECFWNSFGGGVVLGDPCDFFLEMGMVPADGSCDHKLNQ